MSDLLDPAFVRELEALRRRLEIRARSGASGERAAPRRGGSAEFAEHRAYAPGDDVRRIDWRAWARSGDAVVKLFRAEEDVVARLLVDASASMRVGSPPKIDTARRIAAAMGWLALASSERAQVVAIGEGVRRAGRTARGRAGLPSLLRDLAATAADGTTRLAAAIDAVVRGAARPGLLVVVSDFFDPGPVTAALVRARAAGHDLAIVQVLDASELEPALEGDLVLEDVENGATIELTADAEALEAYAARLAGLVEELRATAKRAAATYVRARSDAPLEDVVRRIVARAVD